MIDGIKDFAGNKLNLNVGGNYTTFYDQGSGELIWVVTACKPFRLEDFEWNFPIIGKFSYKGFFDKDLATKEESELKKLGYDTNMRNAEGWSTLGILKDPILSGMLQHGESDLADLIIHELTHGTIFLKNNVEFNENLASFIGSHGALDYLKYKYGEGSREYLNYLSRMNDRQKYNAYILRSYTALDSLYNSFKKDDSYEFKIKAKNRMLQKIVNNLDTIRFSPEYRSIKFFSDGLPDNTYFMSFKRYRGMQIYFENEFIGKFGSDLIRYIDFLKKKYRSFE
jgi:predicted aminopeptidase